jgi:hypothetical protein
LSIKDDRALNGLPNLSDEEDGVTTGLENLSIDDHDEAETTLSQNTESRTPTMATATGAQNGMMAEAARVPNIIVNASPSAPIIQMFRGKEGEDIDSFRGMC